jgi:hypothetical protein
MFMTNVALSQSQSQGMVVQTNSIQSNQFLMLCCLSKFQISYGGYNKLVMMRWDIMLLFGLSEIELFCLEL